MVDLISGINTNKLQILESIWGNVRVELGVMQQENQKGALAVKGKQWNVAL